MSDSTPSTHPHPNALALAAIVLLACGAGAARAEPSSDAGPAPAPVVTAEPPPPAHVAAAQLERVEISARHYDNAVGSSDAASQGVIRAELLKSRPAQRPGEVLEFVPGVIVTQHSGDGKANQYFLRGFNLDHGTDFATRVNGLPVNMPSHAHGQGYSDLNFLLPELVERIEYRKGPYFAGNGNFSAAGSADIVYRQRLDAPFALLTVGERGFVRGVGAGLATLAGDARLLGALELQRNDGPWTVPEGLRRANGVLTLSGGTERRGYSASFMAYDARWTATDQVPERLVREGRADGTPFGRFDSLDPSTGGETSRTSVSGEWYDVDGAHGTRVSAYAMDYRLSLFSNFTYALERPLTGDQFSQQDKRQVYGLAVQHGIDHTLGTLAARSEIGLQLRHDRARVGLFDSVARVHTATTRDDRLRETLAGAYGQTAVEFTPWLRGVAGLRADSVRFTVDDQTAPGSASARDHQLSPKLTLVAGPWARTELFFNAGRGLHSNDARGATAATDPAPGLVASRGMELGARTEWLAGLQSSLALWALDSDSELVYVGDAGITESARASKRRGVEWNNRWAPRPWFLVDADLAWSHARFTGPDPDGAGDRIPNAVDKVASFAVSVKDLGPWSGSLQLRYLGTGALVEDNSQRSVASLITNLRVGRRLWRDAEITLDVFNLFDREVDDIQYHYASQPRGEAAQVGRHVHPAEPRTLRVTLRVGF